MSGAEAITIVGLFASVITIIETSRHIYDAAQSAAGLHEAFEAVSLNVPLVLNILRACKKIQEAAEREADDTMDDARKQELNDSNEAVRPILEACRDNAQKLQSIFDEVVPAEDASRLERYRKAAKTVMPGKKRKVEDLMREILEKLQLLHTNQFFKVETERQAEAIDSSIQRLADLPSSLPDEEGVYSHSGSGSMNINTGPGTQHNYTQSGGSNNRQYNAHTQNFRD